MKMTVGTVLLLSMAVSRIAVAQGLPGTDIWLVADFSAHGLHYICRLSPLLVTL